MSSELNDLKNPINRGNGVANDNLASLADLLIENHKKLHKIQEEVGEVKTLVKDIDKKNEPREKKSFWLLVLSILFAFLSLLVGILPYIVK